MDRSDRVSYILAGRVESVGVLETVMVAGASRTWDYVGFRA